MLWLYARLAARFEKAFQPFVPEAFNHVLIVYRIFTLYKCALEVPNRPAYNAHVMNMYIFEVANGDCN